jgi:hypothetical protein
MLDRLLSKNVDHLSGLGSFIFTSQQNTFIITFSKSA